MPKEDNRVLVGMNGFGRFALNLLWWWFNDRHAPYRIGFINGEQGIFFECSGGRSSGADLCRPFLVGKAKTVIVSATCYDADATLVMGYNHESFDPTKHKVVSYGSCTVNPGVVLTATMNDMFCVVGCTVHVIHNVQEHRLLYSETQTLH